MNDMDIDLSKIKLIIWDLDNTFWNGIISETEIEPIEQNIRLINQLADGGIINSICSKNTFEVCEAKLKELSVFDLFVFSSIDWTPKGQRVKEMIKNMSLRPENVLFIDDDITNLNEAKFYLPSLMIAEPSDVLTDLYRYASQLGAKDPGRERLSQYKVLEKKYSEQKKYDSNEEFLFASNIKVNILYDCQNQRERIHELIIRSNQLNFTKKRISLHELELLIQAKNMICGYVTVSDKFGDYGIVGFFAIENGWCEHFLFSCRTIGLGIEQYVYASLGWPALQVVGEVVKEVDKSPAPAWINRLPVDNAAVSKEEHMTVSEHIRVLVKGPCDLSKSMTYIKNSDQFTYEFTYVNEKKHNIIEAHNHSIHILGLIEYSAEIKKQIADECIFVDPEILSGTFFTGNYDIIFLSTLIESNYGIYRSRSTGAAVSFGSYLYPLTDNRYHKDYINGRLYNGNNVFDEDYLATFSSLFEFAGMTTGEDYVERLESFLRYLPRKTTLCLILGVEFPCERSVDGDFSERHIAHRNLNNAIREFALQQKRIKLIDLNDIVKQQSDFTNNINHFTSRVYYEMSRQIIHIINEKNSGSVTNYPLFFVYVDNIISSVKSILKKFLKKDSSVYKRLYGIYRKISRKK